MAEARQEVLRGKRVLLSPLHMDNIHQHFDWNNDPELNRMDSELPFEKEGFGDFKQRFEDLVYHPSPAMRDFEIHAEDGTLIGIAYVANVSPHNRHCMVGITIGNRNYWGRRYGRESLEVLLDFCFNELGLHRVGTETFEYNTAWKRLVIEAGFRKEGTEREYLYRDGQFWDKEVFSLLEPEYRARDTEHSLDRTQDGARVNAAA
jgi:RimJ/RimL family protein N-acetyltransferase